MTPPEPALSDFLHDAGLAEAHEDGAWFALTGGLSSDIWRVETSKGVFCVKRALAKLKVAAEWKADVSRNAFEWAYMQVAARIAPGAVPTPIVHDPKRGLFAMAWLPPENYPLWKAELLAGRVDRVFAGAAGDLVGRLHAGTAADTAIPDQFATDANFHALRIDAYLLETARVHPDLAGRITMIAERTASTKRALVHGDVSPKNILVGGDGPVLLDAEVAWFGDPAFDLAFCLNHLVIKARIVTGAQAALIASFDQFAAAYLKRVDWESRAGLEARAAALLPVLALARVDGKSPVEYLDEQHRGALRGAARQAILQDINDLAQARSALLVP